MGIRNTSDKSRLGAIDRAASPVCPATFLLPLPLMHRLQEPVPNSSLSVAVSSSDATGRMVCANRKPLA